jgi:hypothetical protein
MDSMSENAPKNDAVLKQPPLFNAMEMLDKAL